MSSIPARGGRLVNVVREEVEIPQSSGLMEQIQAANSHVYETFTTETLRITMDELGRSLNADNPYVMYTGTRGAEEFDWMLKDVLKDAKAELRKNMNEEELIEEFSKMEI